MPVLGPPSSITMGRRPASRGPDAVAGTSPRAGAIEAGRGGGGGARAGGEGVGPVGTGHCPLAKPQFNPKDQGLS